MTRFAACLFQSTPPVKAATFDGQPIELVCGISIHAAREGGDGKDRGNPAGLVISIHAAREGGDRGKHGGCACRIRFQSTPPVKAATKTALEVTAGDVISIHAAREGGDKVAEISGYGLPISIHAAREGGDHLF